MPKPRPPYPAVSGLFGKPILIKISNTGIGIKKDGQEKLFQEFKRIKNKSTEDIPGTGLGLSILKRIVDLYKGSIIVESEENIGTRFNITLKNK